MSNKVNIAIVGHSSSGLNSIEEALQEDPEIDITRKLLGDWVVDPFEDLPVTCSVIVLDLGDNWQDILDTVASRVRRKRTPIIVVGSNNDTEMMRLAIRAGARDFQTRPLNYPELISSVHRLANEEYLAANESSSAKLAVFLSAKGGAGASAIIASLGHALKRRDGSERARILLIDLDLQHGNLPIYFDQSSNSRLTQALIAKERVDTTLLDACVIPGASGVDLLASYSDQVFSPWETPQSTISNLLNLVCDRYEYVLVDIPRQIDPITFQAIEMASVVNIVMQQALSDLRYARQILYLLRDQGIPNERLRVVLNRFDKKNTMQLRDVMNAFDPVSCTTIPNDYKKMSYATDNAVPLVKKYRQAPVSKSIVSLANEIFPLSEEEPRRGFFKRR